MSNQETKESRSRRIQKSRNKGIKRFKNAKTAPLSDDIEYSHKFTDRAWYVNCGNSNCVMCGNPRKFWSELTLKEKSDAEVTNLEFRDDLGAEYSDDSNGCTG